jgi:kojibiose phosphorylase
MKNAFCPRDAARSFWSQETAGNREYLGSVFALSNGYLGLRGSNEEAAADDRPEFYVAGTFAQGPPSLLGIHDEDHILSDPERIKRNFTESLCVSTLPNLPNPACARLLVDGKPLDWDACKLLSREKQIHTDRALMERALVFRDGEGRKTRVESARFVSFADRNLVCLRYRVLPQGHTANVEARGFIHKDVSNANGARLFRLLQSREEPSLCAVSCLTNETDIQISIAQKGKSSVSEEGFTLDLFSIAGEMEGSEAVRRAEEAAEKGFDAQLAAHTAAYRAEAEAARVSLDADLDTAQGFHFGQMHLHMAFPYGFNTTGVPAKGLTGHGYRFACFWDMDFHMFPYYLYTKPAQAHLLLEYRYNQLDKYRENAKQRGAAGAQVPWETQTDGGEATAPWLCLPDREIHISADAAYMFKLYDELTPNRGVMLRMGAEFIMETARFYVSRMKLRNGRYEIPNVG